MGVIKLLLSLKAKMGRPRSRPIEVIGDSAYDNRDTRAHPIHRSIKANIDVNPRNKRKPKPERLYRLGQNRIGIEERG